jgi:replication factor A1
MPVEDIVRRILSSHPDFTREEVLTMVEQKEKDAKGFLTRESAARAVAAKLGVEYSSVPFKRRISIRHLVSGLGDVTVTGRVILVKPLHKFIRVNGSEGKVRQLSLADKTGEMKVVLWDDKAEIPNVKDMAGRIVRFSHGYVRRGFDGGLELNIGSRGKVETPQDLSEDEFPPLASFFKKIGEITGEERTVNVLGVAGQIYRTSTFNRDDGSEGKVRRLELTENGDKIIIVLWNNKVDELAEIESGRHLEIFGGKVRESFDGGLELHVDSSTDTAILSKEP